MRTLVFCSLLVATTAHAGADGVIFHPHTHITSGVNGPATALFVAAPSIPVNSVKLTPVVPFDDSDHQWLVIPLTLPVSEEAGRVASVSVCYKTYSANGTAYISQTRLTQQLLPGPVPVVFDDPTDHYHRLGECYTATLPNPLQPGGILTLSLRIVMADLTDRIEVSGGFVRMVPR